MKHLIIITFCGLLSLSSVAQNAPRRISYHTIGKDSINLALNEDYYLIEDSCVAIIRYGHFNIHTRKFFGHFRDVSKVNPNLILAEGNYTPEGLKDGDFEARYLNGNMQSKGSYKNDRYDGKWAVFYDSGKPKLNFEASGNIIKITDAWNEAGIKTVNNGAGNYLVSMGIIYWKGKLLNGLPDGKWKGYKIDDATNTVVISESFKNGEFKGGNGPLGDYTDASRLVLVSADMPKYVTAEKMQISAVACNGVKPRHVVNAQYSNGLANFSEQIKDVVTPYLSKVDIKAYEDVLEFTGEVSPSGSIAKLNSNSPFNQDIARGIIGRLHMLPLLEPATVDGKPVSQKFTIVFTFRQGMYSFRYQFLPIK